MCILKPILILLNLLYVASLQSLHTVLNCCWLPSWHASSINSDYKCRTFTHCYADYYVTWHNLYSSKFL